MSTKKLALSSMLTAVSVVILWLASVVPSGALALTALASIPVAAAIVSAGFSYGAACYIVASLLAFLLLPTKSMPLFFALFFGHYPILKGLIENQRNLVLEWILKIIVFNICLSIAIFGFTALISVTLPSYYLLYIAGNAVFIIYDIGYSKLITFYIHRISKYIK